MAPRRVLSALVLFAAACAPTSAEYELEVPKYFPLLSVPRENPLTVDGIELGRRLYYDPKLSIGGPLEGQSCSSCHSQSLSFGSAATGTSVLPHVNLAWSTVFLWNGKIEGTLEDIMRFEVNDFFKTDLRGIKDDPDYAARFEKAFGSKDITPDAAARALAQWFRRLTSTNSKYDRFLRKEEALSEAEQRGLTLFETERGDCFHCHATPLFTDDDFHNIGLEVAFEGEHQGRYAVTNKAADLGAFKTPTLRNVALTAPYMHDGRFQTLEQVVEHYNSGVHGSATLDPIMSKAGKTPGAELALELTSQEKADLVAFLKALTDDTFLTDPALASPF